MKTALLGCKGPTLDLLKRIHAGNIFRFDQVITLPRDLAERNRVAYFRGEDVKATAAAEDIPCYRVSSYNLLAPEDQAFFHEAGIDLLVVTGWERLIPNAVLATLGRFACGMHGSPFGLPRGRGRSPMNWAVLTGHDSFITYLFRFTPGIDDGDIIGFRTFDINPFDDIATLHAKNRIAMAQILETNYPAIENGTATFAPQPAEEPTFYPKRQAEDGIIDWSWKTESIHDLIRAVAPPYPGAYGYYKGRKMIFVDAQPFDNHLFKNDDIPAGTIVDILFSLGQFVVKTLDGVLLVKRFEGIPLEELELGVSIEGGDQQAVIEDICKRYPDGIPERQREICP